MNHPYPRKGPSLFLCVVIFFTNTLLAHALETNFWAERKKSQIQLASLPAAVPLPNPVPKRVSSLREITNSQLQSSKSKSIIYIQDVHMNPEAQENIGKAVLDLVREKKIDLVALEGAWQPIDMNLFQKFPDQTVVHDVADYLFKEGEISGPIHHAMKSPTPLPPFVGVDDPSHYKANVNTYQESTKIKAQLSKDIKNQKDRIQQEKKTVFNSSLLEFDQTVQRYREGKIGISSYLKALRGKTSSLSAIATFLEALDLETTLNFSHVERQRTRLLKDLLPQLDKDQTQQLTEASFSFRAGHLRHGDFYPFIQQLCESKGISLNRFPAFRDYLHYVLLSETINAEKLFDEMRTAEQRMYASLTETEAEEKLVRASRWNYLLGKLSEFSLTREEWEEYKKREKGEERRDQGRSIFYFEEFYRQAEIRDREITENVIKALDEYNATTAILVTGGFHSDGLTSRFTKAGLATRIFVPKITKVEKESGTAYLSVFTQNRVSLDDLFKGKKLFTAPRPIDMTKALVSTAMLSSGDPSSILRSVAPKLAKEVRFFKLAGRAFARIRNVVLTAQRNPLYIAITLTVSAGLLDFLVSQSSLMGAWPWMISLTLILIGLFQNIRIEFVPVNLAFATGNLGGIVKSFSIPHFSLMKKTTGQTHNPPWFHWSQPETQVEGKVDEKWQSWWGFVPPSTKESRENIKLIIVAILVPSTINLRKLAPHMVDLPDVQQPNLATIQWLFQQIRLGHDQEKSGPFEFLLTQGISRVQRVENFMKTVKKGAALKNPLLSLFWIMLIANHVADQGPHKDFFPVAKQRWVKLRYLDLEALKELLPDLVHAYLTRRDDPSFALSVPGRDGRQTNVPFFIYVEWVISRALDPGIWLKKLDTQHPETVPSPFEIRDEVLTLIKEAVPKEKIVRFFKELRSRRWKEQYGIAEPALSSIFKDPARRPKRRKSDRFLYRPFYPLDDNAPTDRDIAIDKKLTDLLLLVLKNDLAFLESDNTRPRASFADETEQHLRAVAISDSLDTRDNWKKLPDLSQGGGSLLFLKNWIYGNQITYDEYKQKKAHWWENGILLALSLFISTGIHFFTGVDFISTFVWVSAVMWGAVFPLLHVIDWMLTRDEVKGERAPPGNIMASLVIGPPLAALGFLALLFSNSFVSISFLMALAIVGVIFHRTINSVLLKSKRSLLQIDTEDFLDRFAKFIQNSNQIDLDDPIKVSAIVSDVDRTMTLHGRTPLEGENLDQIIRALTSDVKLMAISGSPYYIQYNNGHLKINFSANALQRRVANVIRTKLKTRRSLAKIQHLSIDYISGQGSVRFDSKGNEQPQPEKTEYLIPDEQQKAMARAFAAALYASLHLDSDIKRLKASRFYAELTSIDDSKETYLSELENFIRRETGLKQAGFWPLRTEFVLIFPGKKEGDDPNGADVITLANSILKEVEGINLSDRYTHSGAGNFSKFSLIDKKPIVEDKLDDLELDGLVLGFGDSNTDTFLGKKQQRSPFVPIYLGKAADVTHLPDAITVRSKTGKSDVQADGFGPILKILLDLSESGMTYREFVESRTAPRPYSFGAISALILATGIGAPTFFPFQEFLKNPTVWYFTILSVLLGFAILRLAVHLVLDGMIRVWPHLNPQRSREIRQKQVNKVFEKDLLKGFVYDDIQFFQKEPFSPFIIFKWIFDFLSTTINFAIGFLFVGHSVRVMDWIRAVPENLRWAHIKWLQLRPSEERKRKLIETTNAKLSQAKSHNETRDIVDKLFFAERGGWDWADSQMEKINESSKERSSYDRAGAKEQLLDPLVQFLVRMVKKRGGNLQDDISRKISNKRLLMFLIQQLEPDEDPYLIKSAARGIGLLADQLTPVQSDQIAQQLITVLKNHKEPAGAAAAAKALKFVMSSASIGRILDVLNDETAEKWKETQWYDAYLLEALEKHIEIFRPTKHDYFINNDKLLATLNTKIKQAPVPSARAAAIRALVAIPQFDSDFLSEMEETFIQILETDWDPTVQEAAVWALVQTRAKMPPEQDQSKSLSFLQTFVNGDHFKGDGPHRRHKELETFVKDSVLHRPSILKDFFSWKYWAAIIGIVFPKTLPQRENPPPITHSVVFIETENGTLPKDVEAALYKDDMTPVFAHNYYTRRTSGGLSKPGGHIEPKFQDKLLVQILNRLNTQSHVRLQQLDKAHGAPSDILATVAVPLEGQPIVVVGTAAERSALEKEIGQDLRHVTYSQLEKDNIVKNVREVFEPEIIQLKEGQPVSDVTGDGAEHMLQHLMPEDWTHIELVEGMQFKARNGWWDRHLARKSDLDYHSGTDLARGKHKDGRWERIPYGSEILSITDGVVMTVVEDDMRSSIFVKTNIMDSEGNHLVLHYTHMELDKEFRPGQIIRKGQRLGTFQPSRNPRSITGAHLHISSPWMNTTTIRNVVTKIEQWKLNMDEKKGVIWKAIDPMVNNGVYSYFDPLDLFHEKTRKEKFRMLDTKTDVTHVLIIHPTKKPPIWKIKSPLSQDEPGIYLVSLRAEDLNGTDDPKTWDRLVEEMAVGSNEEFDLVVATDERTYQEVLKYSKNHLLYWEVVLFQEGNDQENQKKLLQARDRAYRAKPIRAHRHKIEVSTPIEEADNGLNGINPTISPFFVTGWLYMLVGLLPKGRVKDFLKGTIALVVAPVLETIAIGFLYFQWMNFFQPASFGSLIALSAVFIGLMSVLFALAHLFVFDNTSTRPHFIRGPEFLTMMRAGLLYSLILVTLALLFTPLIALTASSLFHGWDNFKTFYLAHTPFPWSSWSRDRTQVEGDVDEEWQSWWEEITLTKESPFVDVFLVLKTIFNPQAPEYERRSSLTIPPTPSQTELPDAPTTQWLLNQIRGVYNEARHGPFEFRIVQAASYVSSDLDFTHVAEKLKSFNNPLIALFWIQALADHTAYTGPHTATVLFSQEHYEERYLDLETIEVFLPLLIRFYLTNDDPNFHRSLPGKKGKDTNISFSYYIEWVIARALEPGIWIDEDPITPMGSDHPMTIRDRLLKNIKDLTKSGIKKEKLVTLFKRIRSIIKEEKRDVVNPALSSLFEPSGSINSSERFRYRAFYPIENEPPDSRDKGMDEKLKQAALGFFENDIAYLKNGSELPRPSFASHAEIALRKIHISILKHDWVKIPNFPERSRSFLFLRRIAHWFRFFQKTKPWTHMSATEKPVEGEIDQRWVKWLDRVELSPEMPFKVFSDVIGIIFRGSPEYGQPADPPNAATLQRLFSKIRKAYDEERWGPFEFRIIQGISFPDYYKSYMRAIENLLPLNNSLIALFWTMALANHIAYGGIHRDEVHDVMVPLDSLTLKALLPNLIYFHLTNNDPHYHEPLPGKNSTQTHIPFSIFVEWVIARALDPSVWLPFPESRPTKPSTFDLRDELLDDIKGLEQRGVPKERISSFFRKIRSRNWKEEFDTEQFKIAEPVLTPLFHLLPILSPQHVSYRAFLPLEAAAPPGRDPGIDNKLIRLYKSVLRNDIAFLENNETRPRSLFSDETETKLRSVYIVGKLSRNEEWKKLPDPGGALLFIKNLFFRHLTYDEYKLKEAHWVENSLMMGGILLASGLIAYFMGINFVPVFVWTNTIAWVGIFALLHVLDWLLTINKVDGERAPPENIIVALFIGLVTAALGLTAAALPSLPTFISFLFFYVPMTIFIHWQTNKILFGGKVDARWEKWLTQQEWTSIWHFLDALRTVFKGHPLYGQPDTTTMKWLLREIRLEYDEERWGPYEFRIVQAVSKLSGNNFSMALIEKLASLNNPLINLFWTIALANHIAYVGPHPDFVPDTTKLKTLMYLDPRAIKRLLPDLIHFHLTNDDPEYHNQPLPMKDHVKVNLPLSIFVEWVIARALDPGIWLNHPDSILATELSPFEIRDEIIEQIKGLKHKGIPEEKILSLFERLRSLQWKKEYDTDEFKISEPVLSSLFYLSSRFEPRYFSYRSFGAIEDLSPIDRNKEMDRKLIGIYRLVLSNDIAFLKDKGTRPRSTFANETELKLRSITLRGNLKHLGNWQKLPDQFTWEHISTGPSGALLFIKNLFFRHLSYDEYKIKKAWWVESLPGLLILLPVASGIHYSLVTGTSFYPVLILAFFLMAFYWLGIFWPAHILDVFLNRWRSGKEKAHPMNIRVSFLIAILNTVLGLLIIPPFFFHKKINRFFKKQLAFAEAKKAIPAGDLTSYRFSPDGTKFITAWDSGEIQQLDLTTKHRKTLLVNHWVSARALDISRDGMLLVTSDENGIVTTWDLEKRARIATYSHASDSNVDTLVLSPDREHIALGHGNEIVVLNIKTGEKALRLREHKQRITDLQFTLEGNRLLSASADHSIGVWDLDKPGNVKILEGHAKPVTAISIDSNATTLLSGDSNGTSYIWDLRDPDPASKKKVLTSNDDAILAVHMSNDGRTATTVLTQGIVKIWDTETGGLIREIPNTGLRSSAAMISPDGRYISFINYPQHLPRSLIQIKDTESEETKVVFSAPTHEHSIFAAAGTQNQQMIYADNGASVWRWNINYPKPHYSLVFITPDNVRKIVLSPNGERIATIDEKGNAKIVDAIKGETLFDIEGNSIKDLQFDPSGQILYIAANYVVDAIDIKRTLEGGNPLLKQLGRTQSPISALAVNPSGERLAVYTDSALYLVSTTSDDQVAFPTSQRPGRNNPATHLLFSPDDSMILLGHKDGSLFGLLIESGKFYRFIWKDNIPITVLNSSVNGEHVVVGKQNGQVQIFSKGAHGIWSSDQFQTRHSPVHAQFDSNTNSFLILDSKGIIYERSPAGALLFIKNIFFPHLSYDDYKIKKAWWVESLPAFAIFLFVAVSLLVSNVTGGDVTLYLTIGFYAHLSYWTLFWLAHIVDVILNRWRAGTEQASPTNILISTFITGLNIILGSYIILFLLFVLDFPNMSIPAIVSWILYLFIQAITHKNINQSFETKSTYSNAIPTGHIRTQTFTPNGKTHITIWDTGVIQLTDLKTKEVNTVVSEHNFDITSIAISPDGTRLVTVDMDGMLIIWNFENMTPLQRYQNVSDKEIDTMVLSPDRTHLAFVNKNDIVLLNIKTGRIARKLKGHADRISGLHFNSDGTRMISSSFDETIRIWDLNKDNSAKILLLGHSLPILKTSVDEDWTVLLSGDAGGRAFLWDLRAKDPSLTKKELTYDDQGAIAATQVSPDGKIAITINMNGEVSFWNTQNAQRIKSINVEKNARHYSIHPNGSSISYHTYIPDTNKAKLTIVNTESPKEQYDITVDQPAIRSIAMNHDKTRMYVARGTEKISRWAIDQREPQFSVVYEGKKGIKFQKIVLAPENPAHGKRLAAIDSKGNVYVIDIDTETPQPLYALFDRKIKDVKFHPSKNLLYAITDDAVLVFNSGTGAYIKNFKDRKKSPISGLAVSPKGKWVVYRKKGTLYFLSTLSNQIEGIRRTKPKTHSDGRPLPLMFSLDGKKILVGHTDGTVSVQARKKSKRPVTLGFPSESPVTTLNISPDGTQIAFGKENGHTLYHIQNPSGKWAYSHFQLPPPTIHIQFIPSENSFFYTSSNGILFRHPPGLSFPKFWDKNSRRLQKIFRQPGPITIIVGSDLPQPEIQWAIDSSARPDTYISLMDAAHSKPLVLDTGKISRGDHVIILGEPNVTIHPGDEKVLHIRNNKSNRTLLEAIAIPSFWKIPDDSWRSFQPVKEFFDYVEKSNPTNVLALLQKLSAGEENIVTPNKKDTTNLTYLLEKTIGLNLRWALFKKYHPQTDERSTKIINSLFDLGIITPGMLFLIELEKVFGLKGDHLSKKIKEMEKRLLRPDSHGNFTELLHRELNEQMPLSWRMRHYKNAQDTRQPPKVYRKLKKLGVLPDNAPEDGVSPYPLPFWPAFFGAMQRALKKLVKGKSRRSGEVDAFTLPVLAISIGIPLLLASYFYPISMIPGVVVTSLGAGSFFIFLLILELQIQTGKGTLAPSNAQTRQQRTIQNNIGAVALPLASTFAHELNAIRSKGGAKNHRAHPRTKIALPSHHMDVDLKKGLTTKMRAVRLVLRST